MVSIVKPSFARGEISPALYGRVDTAAYAIALRKARNVIVHTYGGASARDGLRYLEPVKDHAATPRLIPFEFKTTDQYVLEFGNLYMRVMRNDAHVLDSSEAEAITGATQADPVVVTTGTHGFSNGQEVFITGITGMTELNGRRFLVANVTATTFELQDQFTGTDIDGTGFTAYSSGGTVTPIFELATPYASADLFELTFVQNADVMTICHKDYTPRELTRTDHDAWTLSEIAFLPTIDDPTGITVTVNTAGTVTDRYQVTAIDIDGQESLPGLNNTSATITGATQANPVVITAASHGFINGDEVEINSISGMTELNGRRFTVASSTTNTFELEGEDGTGHTAYSSGGTATPNFVEVTNSNSTRDNTISWTGVTGADKYAIYRREAGVYGIIGESQTTTFDDENIDPDTTDTPPQSRNPFESGNNPGAVTFFEQRRVFGGSTAFPDTNWFSQVGFLSNFNVSSPVRDDDAITSSLTDRQVNEIRQYLPGNDLLTLTSGSEWRINSGNDTFFSASTIRQKPQSRWGSSFRPPISVGSVGLFVTDLSNSVRTLNYSIQSDNYDGSNMLLFAEHLLENDTIKDWASTRYPESRIHCVLAGGTALSFTFEPAQEVIAWATWDTDGTFESVTSLRGGGDANEDSVYFVVKRTVNGNTVRFIEVWRQRFFEVVEDCFFVDSGLTYDVPITISGITAASPPVVTATSHGLSDGDEIDITDVVWVSDFDSEFTETQPDQLNGGRFKVANSTANTFEVTDLDDVDVDGSAWNAYVSGGVVREAVSTISGFHHLEGETIIALADGNVVENLTVSSGAITLPRKFSRVHAGIRRIADIETLDVESSGGTTQGLKKKINHVTVRFKRSRGLLIGPKLGLLQEMKQREFERLGEPTSLLTGDKKIIVRPDWNTNGRIFLRQKEPLPMTVLALIPNYEPGDDVD